jgi:hypothetical protein
MFKLCPNHWNMVFFILFWERGARGLRRCVYVDQVRCCIPTPTPDLKYNQPSVYSLPLTSTSTVSEETVARGLIKILDCSCCSLLLRKPRPEGCPGRVAEIKIGMPQPLRVSQCKVAKLVPLRLTAALKNVNKWKLCKKRKLEQRKVTSLRSSSSTTSTLQGASCAGTNLDGAVTSCNPTQRVISRGLGWASREIIMGGCTSKPAEQENPTHNAMQVGVRRG